MAISQKRLIVCIGMSLFVFSFFIAGCGQKEGPPQQAVEVKAMQVVKRDTPVIYEFVGQVVAKNQVQIQAKVSGNIIGKMVAGGATVVKGQPLFQIDRRQYETALLNAQATLAQSEAALNNSHMDTIRYQQLAAQQAIAQQVADTQVSTERQLAAVVAANRARVRQAENDLSDTLVVAPFGGRIDVNEMAVGNFVTAGSSVLCTLSSVDPVFVQFSMNENEYLRLAQAKGNSSAWSKDLKLILSDGTQYPLTGSVEQVDRGIAQDTGTMTMKAVFANPQKLLLPGMFARIAAQGEIRQGALLIPQRAVQQMLGKTFVTVVGEGDKAESRPVKMGPRVGGFWIVEEGLKETDHVVVEGLLKAVPGAPLHVVMIEPNDLQDSKQ